MPKSNLNFKSAPPLKGRRILVTGGSSGFGKALVLAFLNEGAKVAACSRHEKDLEPLRKKGALALQADVSKPQDVQRLAEEIRKGFGGLDAAVNNAAVLLEGKVSEQPFEQLEATHGVNVAGPLLVSRAAARLMDSGAIVNITSGLGFFPMQPYGAYCISKAALNMMTRVLALEWEGRILVNAVDPGVAKTRMNPAAQDPPEKVVAVVRCLLGPEGPTGRCFKTDGSEVAWG